LLSLIKTSCDRTGVTSEYMEIMKSHGFRRGLNGEFVNTLIFTGGNPSETPSMNSMTEEETVSSLSLDRIVLSDKKADGINGRELRIEREAYFHLDLDKTIYILGNRALKYLRSLGISTNTRVFIAATLVFKFDEHEESRKEGRSEKASKSMPQLPTHFPLTVFWDVETERLKPGIEISYFSDKYRLHRDPRSTLSYKDKGMITSLLSLPLAPPALKNEDPLVLHGDYQDDTFLAHLDDDPALDETILVDLQSNKLVSYKY
jgi:hypothetical protein